MPTFKDIDGKTIDAETLQGKVVLLAFEGGHYSSAEKLNALHQEFPDKLVLIHVIDLPENKTRELLKANPASGVVVVRGEHKKLEDAWATSMWTSYSLIDQNGNLKLRQVRIDPAWKAARELLVNAKRD